MTVGDIEMLLDSEGFSQTAVDDLCRAAQVSLRTLYRRHRSREGVIAAALGHRADRYLDALADAADIDDLFSRALHWQSTTANQGCLLKRGASEHPSSEAIQELVAEYHEGLRTVIAKAVQRTGGDPSTVRELVIIHEGLVAASAFLDTQELTAACRVLVGHLRP